MLQVNQKRFTITIILLLKGRPSAELPPRVAVAWRNGGSDVKAELLSVFPRAGPGAIVKSGGSRHEAAKQQAGLSGQRAGGGRQSAAKRGAED